MDSHADIPLTPCYARDPFAAANPSLTSFGLVFVGAPPSTGLAPSLFMAPRTTSARAGASAPAVTCVPLSKLPIAPTVKKIGKKVSENKNMAADGSTRPRKKKLARRATHASATKASASSFVPLTANAHNVFDGMPTSFNDGTYMTTMGVGSNNSHWLKPMV
ncbi:hypothetical protein D1007_43021 [Hordeum vulgare]|nr:hypothetical protein D1007_43021 [Hordeum vulgare]